MTTYEKNILDRKVLVKRIEELTGNKGMYTRVPRCAYLFTDCAVEKDGTLSAEDSMDQSVINTLISEGLIKGEIPEAADEGTVNEQITETVDEAEAEETTDTAEAAEAAEDTEDTEETTAPAENGADSLTISLPLDRHTPDSLRRLLNLLFSRGKLLSKATGGNFSVEKELLDALDDAGTITSLEDFISMVQ